MKFSITLAIASAFIFVLVGCKPPPSQPQITLSDLQKPSIKRFFEIVGKGDTKNQVSPSIFGITTVNGKLDFNQLWAAVGVLQPIRDESEMVLDIAYYDPPRPGQPPMQLQLLVLIEKNLGNVASYGDPVVLCDLDLEQVDHVFSNGVPPSLIDEMVRIAHNADWSSTLSVPNTFGEFIMVDPTDHFNQDSQP